MSFKEIVLNYLNKSANKGTSIVFHNILTILVKIELEIDEKTKKYTYMKMMKTTTPFTLDTISFYIFTFQNLKCLDT